jgi:hypothetical protein
MGLFSRLFSGSQKRDTTYQGPRPPQLTNFRLGRSVEDELLNRIAGRNVGFGEGFVDKTTSPLVRSSRARFNQTTLPQFQSQLSATGRRRATGGTGQLGQLLLNQSLAEGDIIGNAIRANELQKRNEIANALTQGQSFATTQANLGANAAAFEKGLHDDQINQENLRRANRDSAVGGLIGTAAGIGSAFLPQSQGINSVLLQQLLGGGQSSPTSFTSGVQTNQQEAPMRVNSEVARLLGLLPGQSY